MLEKRENNFFPIFDHCELALVAGMMENQFVIGLTQGTFIGTLKGWILISFCQEVAFLAVFKSASSR